jgi:hypothetical protein
VVDDCAAGVVQNIFSWKVGGMSQQGNDTKRLDLRILQLEEEVQWYGQLKVSKI